MSQQVNNGRHAVTEHGGAGQSMHRQARDPILTDARRTPAALSIQGRWWLRFSLKEKPHSP